MSGCDGVQIWTTDRLTSPCSCVYPFFREIPKVKWYTFGNCSHMTNAEVPEKYAEVVSDFLLSA